MREPLYLQADGHRTWLKWHRARRKASDPEFTATRILEAMRLGASVEVDLVVHADRGCAILHDLHLDRSTTGSGLVGETAADDLRRLHLRGNDGTPIGDRVMLLEDLCRLLEENPAHPEALLQLDFKEDLSRLDKLTIVNFAAAVGPVADRMILSGGDAGAIAALAAAVPSLGTGYDPTYPGVLDALKTPDDFTAFVASALRTAPTAKIIYLDYELVLAADSKGVDIVGTIHADGRRVDAWTIRNVCDDTVAATRRLLALRVDQITTDDPEGLAGAMT